MLVTIRHGEVLRTVLVPQPRHTSPVAIWATNFVVSVGLSNFLTEDFVVAIDDVTLEEKCVKEVVDVLATAGLVAPQHLAGAPTRVIEKLVAVCKCCGWRLAKKGRSRLLMRCQRQSA